ncbi:hypothetical protein GW17_00037884 [Ensete ventricosum]|nr:hypothetical protein GW17_00037884 [Ensete ventricosum]
MLPEREKKRPQLGDVASIFLPAREKKCSRRRAGVGDPWAATPCERGQHAHARPRRGQKGGGRRVEEDEERTAGRRREEAEHEEERGEKKRRPLFDGRRLAPKAGLEELGR